MAVRAFGFACWALVLMLWSITATAAGERVLHLPVPNEIETLDPQLRTWAAERVVTTMMLEGLTREDSNGDAVPGAAASWDISADGRTYLFHLRPEARFSDGQPVTAADFVYAFRRYVDPKTGGRSTSAIESVLHARDCLSGKLPPEALGVAVVDEHTLSVTLSHPLPFFLNWATLLTPLERQVVERWGSAWTEPGHMVSNGPFVLAAFRRGDGITLVKNPAYWNADQIRLDRIELIVQPSRQAAKEMFAHGDLDVLGLTDEEVRDQRTLMGDQIRIQPLNRIAYYFFNMRSGPLAESHSLRRALALTFEPEAIARKLAAQTAEPANSLVPRSFPAYAHPRLDFAARPMADRLIEARRLYAEAQYGPQHPLVATLLEGSFDRCAAVAGLWKAALGAEIRCKIIDDEVARFTAYRRDEFDIGFVTENAAAPDPLELLAAFRGTPLNAGNLGHYRNAVFDDLLRQADNSPDFLARAEKLARAERILLNDLPAIPLSYGRVAYIVAPRVKGFRMLPSRSFYVDGASVE
ncbi:peptide ABC transporter substrate-binding protein [Aliidongia dinghuensis]|nr:peptide ABC transporter substrate-binding protein [Aliidongia dinghuensis]